MREIRIVPYEPEYRQAVRECVYETGFGGESVAPFFEDRELFADFITLYYTDYEPESAFVALADDAPAGYLLGCVDSMRCDRIMKSQVRPRIVKNIFRGRYKHIGPAARRHIFRVLLQRLRGEILAPPLKEYPAHLHIDLFKPYRRMGAGSLLVNTYLDYLRGRGVRGAHLVTSSFHAEALPFYEKLGFERYATRKITTSFFKEASDKPYFDICFVKKI